MDKSARNTETTSKQEGQVSRPTGPNYVAIVSIIGSVLENFVYGIAIGFPVLI